MQFNASRVDIKFEKLHEEKIMMIVLGGSTAPLLIRSSVIDRDR